MCELYSKMVLKNIKNCMLVGSVLTMQTSVLVAIVNKIFLWCISILSFRFCKSGQCDFAQNSLRLSDISLSLCCDYNKTGCLLKAVLQGL